MKVILLNSPIYRESTLIEENYLPPIGLGYIASALEQNDIETRVIDCVRERLGVAEIIDLVSGCAADYYGINVFTQNYELVREIIQKSPAYTKWLIGGPAVGSLYGQIVDWDTDAKLIIVVGEGELIVPELVHDTCKVSPLVKDKNRSVYIINGDSLYFPKDLDNIALNRGLLGTTTLVNHYGMTEDVIITSRGCMYDCAFCGGARSMHKGVPIRMRSIKSIMQEIDSILVAKSTVSSIRVLDDLFLRSRESIQESIELFVRYPQLSWRAMAHILTFSKALDLLPELKRSGCKELFIGIESGSDRIRRSINKLGSAALIQDAIPKLMDAGIDVKGYFMYGLPGETEEDAQRTFELARSLSESAADLPGSFRLSVFQFRPYHGTKLYNQIASSGRTVGAMEQNDSLNQASQKRSQFNFQSGNYSEMDDACVSRFINQTQALG